MKALRTFVLVAIPVALASACVPTAPTFDQHFSEATRTIQAQQVRNPDAPVANQGKMADGVDGVAAREAVQRYQKSFAEPPANPNMFTIGVGGGAGGGSER